MKHKFPQLTHPLKEDCFYYKEILTYSQTPTGLLLHGMPAGQAVSRFGSAIFFFFFFFFFVVATNLHINLFIKLSPLLQGMYCSNCLQQKRPNENLLLARISRGREPPHPYLCDVNSSFDLFIKPGLNSGGHIAYKF